MATTLNITSASYNPSNKTLQVTVSNTGADASQILLYTGATAITSSSATVLAGATIDAATSTYTPTVTLTVENLSSSNLQTYLGNLWVIPEGGNPFKTSPSITWGTAVQVNASIFGAPTINTYIQSGSSTGSQSTTDVLTVTASEVGAGIAKVTFLDSVTSTTVTVTSAQPDGSWTYTATGLANGAHTFSAVAYDNAGNTTTATVTDWVDQIAPHFTSSGVTQSVAAASTQSTTDTITVTAADNTSGSGVKSVEIYDGTTDFGAATSVGTNTWKYTATGLANGAHTFAAVLTDNAGNATALASSPTAVDVVQPTVISGISQSVSGSWTSSTSDALTVSATSTNSTVKSVEIYDGSTDLGTATQVGTGSNWTYTATSLADGVHTFNAVATDNAGNTASLSATDKVDQTAPVVSAVTQTATGYGTNTATDTFTVTASDTGSGVASVYIYDNGVKESAAAAASGGAYVYTASALPIGVHTFTAVATDNAGNTSSSSPSVIDVVQAAGVTTITQTAGDSTAGRVISTSSTSDTITVTPFYGSGATGVSKVEIYDGTKDLGSATYGSAWTYSATSLAAGAHTFTAVVTDSAGNTNSVATSMPAIDYVQSVGITGVTQSASSSQAAPTNVTSDTITVTASGVATSLDVYDGTKDLGHATLDSLHSRWTYTATGLTDGAHTFAAVATDGSGNSSSLASSPTQLDFVDHTSPVISAVTQTVTGAWNQGTTNTVTVAATDGNGSGLQKVEFYDNGSSIGSVSSPDANGNYILDVTSSLSAGANTFTAVATDIAGNTSTSSLNVIDRYDATPPAFSGDITQTASGSWTKTTSDTLTLTATDATSGVKSVEVYDGAKDLGAATQVGTSTTWKYTATGIADGAHTFTAIVTDNAGNSAAYGGADVVDKVDANGQTLTMVQTGPSTWNKGTSDTITLGVTEAFSGVTLSSLSLTQDGASVTLTGSGPYTYTATGLADGVHTFVATATDSLGNTSAQTLVDAIDTTAPIVSALTGAPSGWTNATSETITGTATDAGSGVASVSVYDNGTWIGSTAVNKSGNFTFVEAGLTAGAHTLTATATDNAGNTSTVTSSSPRVVANVDLTPPAITAITQSASGSVTTSTTDTITVTVGDGTSGSGVKSVQIYDGTTALGAATLSNGAYVYTATGLANGSHTFTAVATDNAGNTATSSAVIDQVSTVVPVVSAVTQSASGSWTPSTSDTVTVTATDVGGPGVASVQVYDGTKALGAATLSNGSWTYTATGLADGAHTFAAVATDSGGNTSALSTSTAVDQVDSAGPSVSGITQSGSSAGTTSLSDALTVTASDATSGVKSVEIYDGTKDLGAGTYGNGAWTYTATGLVGGSHTFAAVATDNAGNTSTLASSPTAIDLVNQTGPVITGFGETGSSAWNQSTSNTLSVTVTDPNTVTAVEIYDGKAALGAATLSNGSWMYTATGLADGVHTFTAVATDSAGNTSSLSAPITDAVDATAPIVSAVNQTATGAWTNVKSDTFTVSVSDGAGSGVKSVEMYDVVNGKTLDAGAAELSNGNWVFTAGGLSEGTNVMYAVATDNVGNKSTTTSPSATDLIDTRGAPDLSTPKETLGTNGQATFSFVVGDLVNGQPITNAPSINLTYWIDQNAKDSSVPTSGTSTITGVSIGASTWLNEAISTDVSAASGAYFHVEAVDALGHASAIYNSSAISAGTTVVGKK